MKTNIFRAMMVFIGFFACLLFPGRSMASVEIDGIFYELNTTDLTAEVVASDDKYSGDVEIPIFVEYEWNRYYVTSIGDNAFYYCNNLESVSMPFSLKRIGDSAFENCDALTSVEIPYDIEYIGSGAFSFCRSLASLTLPNGKYYIGPGFIQNTFPSSIILESRSPNNFSYDDEEESQPFYNYSISGCTLYVPYGCKSAYQSAFFWKNFEYIEELDYLTRGCCGDNVTFTVYPDMTMIVSGTGSVWGTSSAEFNGDYYNTVEKIVVEEGVTSLGDHVFSGYSKLKTITLPNSLKEISFYVFYNCKSLESLSIPRNVEIIGTGLMSTPIINSDKLVSINVDPDNQVFDSRNNCNAVIRTSDNTLVLGCKNTVIPDDITTIGHKSFMCCNGLSSVEIPYGVTSIEWYAFAYCSNLETITIPNSVKQIDGTAFEGTPWYDYQPDGLLYINDVAYRYKGTMPENTSLTLREGTVSISSNAFTNCTNLVSVNIPNSVVSIGSVAFYNCSSLTSITIPNSVTSLGDNAFSGCTGLSSVIMEINTPISITGQTFRNVNKSTCTLYVPYGSKSAYENAQYWKEFENIEELDYLAKGACGDNLTYTIYPDNTMLISGTGDMWDFEGTINDDYSRAIQTLIVEEGVTSIGKNAFSDFYGLSSVSLPNTLVSIGSHAFWSCDDLYSITIPSSVTDISEDAFLYSNLTTLIVEEGNPVYDSRNNCNAIIRTSSNELIIGCGSTSISNSVTSIGEYAFHGCRRLSSVEIPNSVTTIGRTAFAGCWNLISLTIPNSVTSIGEHAFRECTGLNSIIVETGNPIYDSRDNCNAIIESSTNTLLFGCKNTIIPNSVTSIGNNAFDSYYNLISITIPNNVTSIGSGAFHYCSGLTSVIIPNSVISIGSGAFNGCRNLTSVEIPNSVTSIGNGAFSGCSSLASITIGCETPLSIDKYTFNNVDKSTCTLYVPYGSKSDYENAEYWNEFENIVEYDPNPDTDISALANAIYVEQVEGRIGGTKDISIRMKNSYPIRGFQFKLELPEGTTINGWSLSTDRLPSGATTSDKVGTQRIDGNKINVACSLNYGDATFTGSDGEIASVNVSFGEDMETGSYAIYLTECDVNDAAGTDEGLSDIKSTLILEDYVPGDANGDGLVRIGDTTTILNYIVGNASQNFQVKAADVNGDGLVRIGDVTAVLNIIVSQ